MGKKSTKTIGSLALFGIISALFYFAPLSFAKNVRAPEIISPTWINSEPLKLEDLRGNVVMIEFWTFGCWNCRNIEPYVKEWHKKYAKQGLVVIAVHSPEFSYEKEIERVKTYVQENNILYAVSIDNEFRNWRQYHNRYWPTLYVIDKKGTIQYTRIGEGAYEQTEQTIQRLLAEPA
jgi:thiol-disulfide isomerase/thioredoxin